MTKISQELQVDHDTVRLWRERWRAAESRLQAIEATGQPKLLCQAIEVLLTDAQRPGAPATFTFELFMQIMALACEKPEVADRPVSTWTPRELADEAYHLNFWGREKPLMWLKRCCSNKDGMLRGKDEANPQRHM